MLSYHHLLHSQFLPAESKGAAGLYFRGGYGGDPELLLSWVQCLFPSPPQVTVVGLTSSQGLKCRKLPLRSKGDILLGNVVLLCIYLKPRHFIVHNINSMHHIWPHLGLLPSWWSSSSVKGAANKCWASLKVRRRGFQLHGNRIPLGDGSGLLCTDKFITHLPPYQPHVAVSHLSHLLLVVLTWEYISQGCWQVKK